jgi:hypothetical protein
VSSPHYSDNLCSCTPHLCTASLAAGQKLEQLGQLGCWPLLPRRSVSQGPEWAAGGTMDGRPEPPNYQDLPKTVNKWDRQLQVRGE